MKFESLIQVTQHFSDENVCREHLNQLRWPEGIICPHCGTDKKPYNIEGGKRYKCSNKECYKKFSSTSGTIFENTKIKLPTWFVAIYLITSHKKGISSLQLSKDLGVTQKTAWFILHRIREMLKENAPQLLQGEVEIDETYVGGKERNKHRSKRKLNGATGVKSKSPMIGLLEREGNVVLRVIDKDSARGTTIKPIIRDSVDRSASIYTDGFGAYKDLDKEFAEHAIVRHDRGEYVSGIAHTNTIEGFWANLKRGLIGVYHGVSHKHLQRYCDEFSTRYNERDISQERRFDNAIGKANGRRLTYNQLKS